MPRASRPQCRPATLQGAIANWSDVISYDLMSDLMLCRTSQGAIADLQAAVRLEPNFHEARDLLALSHAARGELRTALYAAGGALNRGPSSRRIRAPPHGAMP